MSAIDLVVPCTKRKRPPVQPELVFGSLAPASARELAATWAGRIEQSREGRPVEELYAGPGWTAALEARDAARVLGPARLSVLSAGLGLVREGELVPAYSATFAAEADQVARRVEGGADVEGRHREWWRAINEHRGLGGSPLATRFRASERIVVAGGADYLGAIHEDLIELAEAAGPERLYLISAGADAENWPPALRACLLPIGVELQLVSGGTRGTLNVWAATWVLRQVASFGWERRKLEREILRVVAARLQEGARLPAVGRAHSDPEVKEWIRAELQANASAGGLLAKFRREGRACLDTRFRRLLHEVRQEQQGSLGAPTA